ncbi:protein STRICTOSIDINE SYNTHASE-LIKE 5-like [Fagus crenata]
MVTFFNATTVDFLGIGGKCKWVQSEKVQKISHTRQGKGRVENFIDYLPGMPDNIRYRWRYTLDWVGNGNHFLLLYIYIYYNILCNIGRHLHFNGITFRYPFIRKVLLIMEKKPLAHYYDPGLALVSSGMKIEIICTVVQLSSCIICLDLNQYPLGPPHEPLRTICPLHFWLRVNFVEPLK